MVNLHKLAERIKYLRENLKDKDSKWTQKYVADQIGVARVTYTAYENGTKTPPPDIILKIANLFDVTTDYLLGHEVKDIDSMSDEEIDEEIKEIMKEVDVWYKNEPEDKREKLEMLRKIIKTFTDS